MAFTKLPGVEIYEIDGIEGAAFLLDLTSALPRAGLLPFLGGVPDSDNIIFEPWLGPGVTIGPKIDREFGFRYVLSGGERDGWDLFVLDAQAAKYQDIMGSYPAEGWQYVLRFAKADAPTPVGGEVRFDKFVLDGDFADFDFKEQFDKIDMEPWIPYSYAIYHTTKKNNKLNRSGELIDDYKKGKAGHIPRPVMVLLDGATKMGEVWGRFEKSSLGDGRVLVTKVFDEAEVQAKVSEVGGANFTHFAVDATLGVLDVGVQNYPFEDRDILYLLGGTGESGELNSIHVAHNNPTDFDAAFYLVMGAYSDPNTQVARVRDTPDIDGNWLSLATSDEAFTANATFTAGSWQTRGATNGQKYDDSPGTPDVYSDAARVGWAAAMPATQPTPSDDNIIVSTFITFTGAAPSGGGTQQKLNITAGHIGL